MSFSSDVKREVADKISNARHCRIAQILAMISFCGKVTIEREVGDEEAFDIYVELTTETEATAKTFSNLIEKTFQITPGVETKSRGNEKSYRIILEGEDALKVLQSCKLSDERGNVSEGFIPNDYSVINRECCKRAYVRGAFLAAGSMSDPSKSYHCEFSCGDKNQAGFLINLLKFFNINAKVVARKGNFVVYIKEGESIADILKVMEAHSSLFDVENKRIVKEMSNNLNRQVNCEAANIKRVVTTSVRQANAIRLIIDQKGIDYLPEKLQEIAMLRLENTDASLEELGKMADPPLGKSGVNHRLRKICKIADELSE